MFKTHSCNYNNNKKQKKKKKKKKKRTSLTYVRSLPTCIIMLNDIKVICSKKDCMEAMKENKYSMCMYDTVRCR